MHKRPIVVVAGITRCGSSLMMRMLDHGGMEVVADNTIAYEDGRVLGLPLLHEWLKDCRGKAVKLLDLHHFTPPSGLPYVFIFLLRDPKEQAKSIKKFMKELGLAEVANVPTKKIAASVRTDVRRSLEICRALGPVFLLRFESLIDKPENAARRLAARLAQWGVSADVGAMAAQVRKRSSKCLPYLLERDLLFEENG